MRAVFDPGADPEGSFETMATGCENDLEAAAIRLCPPVARLRDRMRELGAMAAGMSGSGATVYGLFQTESDARMALQQSNFEPPTWTCVTGLAGNETTRN
jgi:4-diphosphocytidyl-2-C-methyl-D-erythritol kinase